jgi:hypothetical protein
VAIVVALCLQHTSAVPALLSIVSTLGGAAAVSQRRPYAILFASGAASGLQLAQSDNPSNLTQNASWIANCQTIGWDISGHNATRADSAVASNANAGKNYRVSANPHVIFDDNWCGRRRHITLFDAMLVPIYYTQVMSQQTMAPNLDLLVCCNRCAVVDERMIAYRNMGTLVRNNFDRDNVPHQANAIPKFHISTSSEINATKKSHRQW